MGQLTLNSSTVSDNTATNGSGGIFNCGGNPLRLRSLHGRSRRLTLNSSTVSNNVGGSR